MKTIVPTSGEDPVKLLHRCGGHYKSPVDSSGKAKGPLVGYAGKYKVDDSPNAKELAYVGTEYANFAALERHGPARDYVARNLLIMIGLHPFQSEASDKITGFVGAPEGGKALATTLSSLSGAQYIFPDKVVTQLKTDSQREKSHFVWGRHTPQAGERWILTEDVCNNFSTTDVMVELIESTGAEVAEIVCFWNRTILPQFKEFFTLKSGRKIRITSLVGTEIAEYRQDDPAVADLVAAGKVFLKPKDRWEELMRIMAAG